MAQKQEHGVACPKCGNTDINTLGYMGLGRRGYGAYDYECDKCELIFGKRKS